MTTIATYGNVTVEEYDRGFAVIVTHAGVATRVGPLFTVKHKATRFALEMSEVVE